MQGISFEWDAKKNVSNRKKHRVSFEKTRSVFNDEFARIIRDPDHSEKGEESFVMIGVSDRLRLLVVCHCESNGNTIRIISARKANSREKKQYEEYINA